MIPPTSIVDSRNASPPPEPPAGEISVVNRWVIGSLPDDVEAALSRAASARDVRGVAVLPDVHLAGDVCVGTVLATRHLLYPAAVGGDAGCGMAALAFDCGADVLAPEDAAGRLLAGLYRAVPTTRRRDPIPLPAELDQSPLSDARLEALKRRDARVEFGTLGRGNHFVEFQADEEDRLWLMLHSGSRAVGPAVRDLHLPHARRGPGGLRWLDARTPRGQAYLSDLAWAAAYADANRRAMVEAVAALVESLFGVQGVEGSYFACDHNHVRRETHTLGGVTESLWVHRKGAIAADENLPGILPGSMGSPSFHVAGRGHPDALRSSSHGAGRSHSRTDARRIVTARDLERQMRHVWFDHRLADRLRDEAPSAYKDVGAVLRAQKALTRVVRKLRPVLAFKGA